MKSSILLSLLVVCIITNATTYYVRTDGNDTNAGTSNTSSGAWRTIQKAANTMVAGDTANVASGNYDETVSTKRNGSAGNYIRFVGTSLPRIKGFVFDHAYNEANGFLVTGAGLTFAYLFNSGGHYTRVIGNSFTNTSGRSVSHYYYAPYASNVWVEGNRFDQWNGIGVAFGGSGHVFTNNWMTSGTGFDAMNVLAQNVTIVGNTFTNIFRPPTSDEHTDIIQVFNYPATPGVYTNVIFERNLVINSQCQIGMVEDQENLGNVNHWTFRNNLFINVGAAIQIYAPDFYWYNNTFYRCAQNTGGPVLFRTGGAGKGDGNNGRMYNNIFFECGSNPGSAVGGYYGYDGGTGPSFLADYNLVVGTGAGTTKTGFSEAHGINGSNPQFVSAGTSNLKLLGGSPCIGTGINLSIYFQNDYSDMTRINPWDIGAYKYATSPTPLPPTCTFSASSQTITAGQSTTLVWTSANTTSLSINNGIGAVSPLASGSFVVTPAVSTTYALSGTGPGGSVSCSTTVTVIPIPPPPVQYPPTPTGLQLIP